MKFPLALSRLKPLAVLAVVCVVAAAGGCYSTRTRLPYHWDKLHGAVDGQARFRLSVTVQDTAAPLAPICTRRSRRIWDQGSPYRNTTK